MNMPIIEVKNLSKHYFIGHKGAFGSYRRLSEIIVDYVRHPVESIRGARSKKEEIWALKDVSFNVDKGEVIGLIGRNGAGKTTVLKIMSKITYPTAGEIILRGRVGSLLEVGTGFHPELTGRENIYMSGAILGMRKVEIDRNFEDIVKFAEVEKFLDTPVKRYSSGMYVRLAFAVAAHLEPEILLVDEVLAVGDAQFQKKCLGKIKDVSEGGRTVLFVSHNMAAIEGLCKKTIWIEQGSMKMYADSHDVVAEYLRMASFSKENNLDSPTISRKGNGQARFTWLELMNKHGAPVESITEGEPFRLRLDLRVEKSIEMKMIGVVFRDKVGRDILTTIHYDSLDMEQLDRGSYIFSVHIEPNPFLRGNLNIRLVCYGVNFSEYDVIDDAYNFNITPSLDSKDGHGLRSGVVNIPAKWELIEENH